MEYISAQTGPIFGETDENAIRDKSRMFFQENKVLIGNFNSNQNLEKISKFRSKKTCLLSLSSWFIR